MRNITGRLSRLEKTVEKLHGADFSMIIAEAGEDADQARKRVLDELPEALKPKFILAINLGAPPSTEDQEIEKTIQKLLKAGVSREEIDKIIAESSK